MAAKPANFNWFGRNPCGSLRAHTLAAGDRIRADRVPPSAESVARKRQFGPIVPKRPRSPPFRSFSIAAHWLLHSRSAFGIGLPSLVTTRRRSQGCGCSSGVEDDLAKGGGEG